MKTAYLSLALCWSSLSAAAALPAPNPADHVYCGHIEAKFFDLGAPTKLLVLSYPFASPASKVVLMGVTPDVNQSLAQVDPATVGGNLMFCAYSSDEPSAWAYRSLLKINTFYEVPWMPN